MSLAALFIVAVTVLCTSFLSGIFGMAGGMILLGVLLAVLDVPSAMVLWGVTQLASNGWRAFLWRHHVTWQIVLFYVAGAAITFTIMRFIAYVPDKATVYILVGLLPIAADRLKVGGHLDMTKPAVAVGAGLFVMLMQLVAGAAGAVLDIFFQKSALGRKGIVSTKAVTQTVAHLLRTIYFGTIASAADVILPLWTYAGSIALAMTGTTLAGIVLHRMSDDGFRKWSRVVILSISAVSVLRGLILLFEIGASG